MKLLWKEALLLIGGLLPAVTTHAEPLQAKQYGDFDNYVLALSWQTGFCQSLHDRHHKEPKECRTQRDVADKRAFLTVHGLWPGLPKSIASHGVDDQRWMRYGCATRPLPDMAEVKASKKCAAPDAGLSVEMASKLAGVMPGAAGKSCLERYEYAKHGVCFGFNPDDYFGSMVRLNGEVKQSAFGDFLAQNYGKVVTRGAFNNALAQSWGAKAASAVKLTCSGNPAYLTEMQITLRADNINQPLQSTSFVPQNHPGNCEEAFRLDALGY